VEDCIAPQGNACAPWRANRTGDAGGVSHPTSIVSSLTPLVTAHDAIYERRRCPVVFRIVGRMALDIESSRRAHSVPRPAFGGAMLALLRVRRVARLRRRPELDGASRPLRRAGSWQPPSFSGFLGEAAPRASYQSAERKDSVLTDDRG